MRRIAAKIDRVCRYRGARWSNSSGASQGRSIVLAVCFAANAVSGCQRPSHESDTAARTVPSSSVNPVNGSSAGREVPSGETANFEDPGWYVIQMGGRAVGYSHRTISLDERRRMRTLTEETVLRYTREGNEDQERWRYYSRELPDGAVVECGWTSQSRHDFHQSRIVVEENKASVETRVSESAPPTRHTISWPPGTGGYFALEQSLARQPMLPGEERKIDGVTAGINEIMHFHAKAASPALTRLLDDHEVELQPIHVEVRTDADFLLNATLWADTAGLVWKQEISQLDQVILRADKATALASHDSFDVGFGATVPVDGKPPNVATTKAVSYDFTSELAELSNAFSSTAWQRVQVINAHHVRVTVIARDDEPKWDHLPAPSEEQLQRYLQATDLAQSDHPEIRKAAFSIAFDAANDRAAIDAIVEDVNHRIKVKDTSRSLASALEVLQSENGDCTEHAVLLAAFCRARGIPARGVVGLMLAPNRQELAFHMWNEIWLNDAWIPVDATWGIHSVGTDHIRLSEISLQHEQLLLKTLDYTRLLRELRSVCSP